MNPVEIMQAAIRDNMIYVVNAREAKVFAQAALTALQDAGYAVAPVEPSEGVIRAGLSESMERTTEDDIAHIYRAMIAAATAEREGV